MKKTATVEILTVGNEILTGDILDTNTNWLCKLVHGRGGAVVRVTVLPDILDIIAEAVRAAVKRNVDIIITSGGLGPTSDDLTLQAVAAGTDREVTLNPKALEMVKDQYDYFVSKGILSQGGLTPAREKMAYLPKNADPLFNGVGTAPGSFLKVGTTSIISVPGVPAELKQIINESLKDFFDETFGEGDALSRRVTVKSGCESLLEPVLNCIVRQYPDIYTKSLASVIEEKAELDIIMTMTGIGEKEVLLNKAFQELCSRITELGFMIEVKEA